MVVEGLSHVRNPQGRTPSHLGLKALAMCDPRARLGGTCPPKTRSRLVTQGGQGR
jgi:hypothetical protein